MNSTIETLKTRVSLRRYDTKEIEQEHLSAILKAAFVAPTAGNMMLYTIIRVTDQELKEKLAVSCDNQPFIATAPEVLIFCADWQKWEDYYQLCNVEKIAKQNNRQVHHAKAGEFILAVSDALIAAQNAVIAAESLNIGSCYIGDIIEHYEYHRDLLDLPQYVFPIAMVTLGYYPKDYQRVYRTRFNEKFVVSENKYQRLSNQDLNEMFEHCKYPEQLFENFGQFMYNRKSGTEFIAEMTRSLKAGIEAWEKE